MYAVEIFVLSSIAFTQKQFIIKGQRNKKKLYSLRIFGLLIYNKKTIKNNEEIYSVIAYKNMRKSKVEFILFPILPQMEQMFRIKCQAVNRVHFLEERFRKIVFSIINRVRINSKMLAL